MIKQLKYSITFPSNLIRLECDLKLQSGSTSVIGPNGSGKTFGTIEMVRWLLFGTKALRGPAKDYKSLKSSGVITIAGADYTIERSTKKSTLKNEAGEILAVNAEAVNQKIIELLGYGLEVFDVVNAARQKDTDRISKLRPAARKKLIDDIIGLGAQEQVEKDCRAEATSHRRVAEMLEDQLARPIEPVKPEGYRKSEELQSQLDAVTLYNRQRSTLEAKIVSVGDAPAEPSEVNPSSDGIRALEQLQAEYMEKQSKISSLERSIGNAFTTTAALEDVEASEEYYRLKALDEARGPKADYTEQQLDEMEQTWAVRKSLTEIGEKEVTCPECNHIFCPSHEAPAAPVLDRQEIKAQRERLRKWEVDVPAYDKPSVLLTKAECIDARKAFEQLPLIQKWEQELAVLKKSKVKDVSRKRDLQAALHVMALEG